MCWSINTAAYTLLFVSSAVETRKTTLNCNFDVIHVHLRLIARSLMTRLLCLQSYLSWLFEAASLMIEWSSFVNFAEPKDSRRVPPDHLLLDSAPNIGPLTRWELDKFKNCWYKSVRILKLLFQQFLNLSSSQRDMSGPILGALSNNRWTWGRRAENAIARLFHSFRMIYPRW